MGRKALMATSALACVGALAAGPASAADMLTVGVGGYMQQWVGAVDRNDAGAEGGVGQHSDGEIHFKGALESDMGMKYSVHVELEADRGSGAVKDDKVAQNFIDETYVRVTGDFGQLEIGGRDHAMVRMHYGISDVGVGLNAGDTQKWIPGAYLETSGHAIGNARKINYITPRINGLQVGVSYAPDDTTQLAASTPTGNDNAGWGAAVNFQQELADMMVSLSLGHRSKETAGAAIEYMSGAAPAAGAADMRLTPNQVAAHKKTILAFQNAADLMPAKGTKVVPSFIAADGDSIAEDAREAQNALLAATDGMVTRGDNATYTNAGIGITMGAWGFNIAWAEQDGGAYTTAPANVPIRQGGAAVIDPDHMYDGDGDGTKTAESATNNDPGNDTYMAQSVVKDGSKDYSVVGVSVSYTDGPMAFSLGHMMHEEDAGGERTATMLSGSYTLGPGVAWKTSLFQAEDTTSNAKVDHGVNEGTAIVTGITLNF